MKLAVTVFALLAAAGTANAEFVDLNAGELTVSSVRSLSSVGGPTQRVVDANALYSNVTTFTGQGVLNGGAAGGITRLTADDCTIPNAGTVIGFRFTVANFNTTPTSARARVRFYGADGAGGGPGTLITGFSFNPLSFVANNVTTVTAIIGTPVFTTLAPNVTVWAGITFDNVSTNPLTTNAALDGLGQGVFDPVDLGSSQNLIFTSTAAGSNFIPNPVGTLSSFDTSAGGPNANFGWEFITPAPGAIGMLALGGLVVGRRRR